MRKNYWRIFAPLQEQQLTPLHTIPGPEKFFNFTAGERGVRLIYVKEGT